MARIAFVFPGQGAQEVGMGRDLFDRDPFTTRLIEQASALTGRDMKRLCARGPDKQLSQTALLQPALTAVCLGLWHQLDAAGIRPHVTAGHSLGEIPALAASGFCSPEAVIELAARRGQLMAEAAAQNDGGMVALSGLSYSQVTPIIDALAAQGTISCAAVNAPTQVTLSGDSPLLGRVRDAIASGAGAKVTELRVSGAWHSAHMARAVPHLKRALQDIPFQEPEIPMVFNRHGNTEDKPAALPDLIGNQLTRPVRWDKVMETFAALEVTHVVEIGPGRTLRGLGRLNPGTREMTFINVSSGRTAQRARESLQS